MLIELFGRNFGCFRDEFRLSMLATNIDPGSDRGIVSVKIVGDEEPLSLLRAIAVYGPNASGKSTLLRAAGALSSLIAESGGLSSDSVLSQYESFALGPQAEQPVMLGATFVSDGAVYEYHVSFDRTAVHEEVLSRKSGEPVELLHRVRDAVSGEWTHDSQFELLTRAFRRNVLLLSLADSLAPNLAKSIAVNLRRALSTHEYEAMPRRGSGYSRVGDRIRRDPAFSRWLTDRLRTADVGVVDLRVEERPERPRMRMFDKVTGRLVSLFEQAASVRLSLAHGAAATPVSLPFESESRGTQRLVELYDFARLRAACC